MDVTPQLREGAPLIARYGPEGFVVGGREYPFPILIGPESVVEWTVAGPASITAQSLSPLIAEREGIELILLGSGARQIFIPPAFRDTLRREGIILDVMDTGAACRTFNILLSEGRRVAAALLLPDR